MFQNKVKNPSFVHDLDLPSVGNCTIVCPWQCYCYDFDSLYNLHDWTHVVLVHNYY